jgi:hypothetical protein
MNAEEKHSKRRKNENTKKMKNKKKKSLMKNALFTRFFEKLVL